MLRRTLSRIRSRLLPGKTARPRIGLALSGGGVIGGMYEVGALAALEERLNGEGRGFDVYVGCSAGAVVAALLASGVRASDLYRILDEDADDALNFRRGAVFSSGSFRSAVGRLGRLVWAFGSHARAALSGTIPDVLGQEARNLPSGFFSMEALERFLRAGLASRGLSNSFATTPRKLLVPAVDLDRAERVVFGAGVLADVPISEAVAASSAIPGFFEPYSIGGRDYVDGGVGFTGHADLAAAAGAEIVFVVHPLVPSLSDDGPTMRSRGLYAVLEQANRINGQNLLHHGLASLSEGYPGVRFFLLEPPRSSTELFRSVMSFEAGRSALRYGYGSTKAWLEGEGSGLLGHLLPQESAARPRATESLPENR